MRRRRFILNTGVAASGAGLLVGSGAFSRIEAQRDVTIEVVGDDDAYLRLVFADAEIDDCFETITLVTVQNRLKHAVNFEDITLEYDEDHLTIENLQFPDRLEVGEEGVVEIDVSCTTPEEETSTVSFDIHVEEDLGGVLAQRRSIEVTCVCPDETLWAYGGSKDAGVADADEDSPLNELDGIEKWGWYIEYGPEEDAFEGDLWAAAGRNNLDSGYIIGTVTIDRDDDSLDVTYDLDASLDPDVASVHLDEAHLYVDEDTERLGDIEAAPGQLGYSNSTGQFSVDLTDVEVKDGPNKDVSEASTLIIAAHGVALIATND